MNRDDAIAKLKGAESAIRAMGATALYLFGSTARNEAKPTSDVDIFWRCSALMLVDDQLAM